MQEESSEQKLLWDHKHVYVENTHTCTHTRWSHDFRTFDSYPCGFGVFFLIKTPINQNTVTLPTMTFLCAEPRGLKPPSIWVSRDRWEELRNGGQIITHGGRTCCNHYNNTVRSVSMTVLSDCTASPNSPLHHWCVVSALHNQSSWSFLLLSSVVLLYSPTGWLVLVLSFLAQTATSGPQLVGGEDSQSFSV